MPPTIADYKSPMFPTWCPGCGDFGIWQAIKQALVNLGKDPHEVCIVYGIGCSGNMSSFVRAYGFHSLHGRALASAFGIKLANPRLTVIVVAGDGDTYSEGIQHFLGAIRQNIDINFLVHDNHTFSLTTGQASPTSDQGRKTKVTPAGAPDRPLYPLPLAISQEASFVARGFAGDIPHLTGLVEKMIQHKGFAYADVLQHCPSYDHEHTAQWYWKNIVKLEGDGLSKEKAMKLATDVKKANIGVFYKNPQQEFTEIVKRLSASPLALQKITTRNIAPSMDELR